MIKMKKKLFMLVASLMFCIVKVQATETNEEMSATNLIDYCGGVHMSQVLVGDQHEPLYPEFVNPEYAVNKIYNRAGNLIARISEEEGLEKLSYDNWQEYSESLYKLIDTDAYFDYQNEIEWLQMFFDIFENRDKNMEITEHCNSNRRLGKIKSEELAMMLPYNSKTFTEYNGKKCAGISGEHISTVGINYGISYARRYAEVRNTPTYYSFRNGDCANFTSQILEASGVKQIKYPSPSQGWWHNYDRQSGRHTHSNTWSMADAFARYQGIIYTTRSHDNFKKNISAGSFIVCDEASDGDWDHCGFVTEVWATDYVVAQHTKDYCEPTAADINHWEEKGVKGGTYARVRY